ncbi:zonular occludens toxin [Salmonella enterica]|nr:zonular occludens toxin [Salmonella enterica]EIE7934800.1 zonular occludens toxin [Salmonella enterica]
MAITAYVGLPGAGKSYEMVRSVIIPAMMQGRRIVTNVYGVDNEKIRQYCIEHKKACIDDFGELIFVTNEQVIKSDFYPVPDVVAPVCHAGDLIILDECHRFFDDNKMNAQAKVFAAEHRHYVNEKGHTCDLVLVNQSLGSLSRFLKDRIETTYKMTKLSALGLSGRYRVDIYQGYLCRKKFLVNSYQEKYQPDIYALYQSYDGTNASEKKVDSRNVIFKKSTIIMFVCFIILAISLIVRFVIPVFTGRAFGVATVHHVTRSETSVKPGLSAPLPASSLPSLSQWCVTGFYFDGERNFVLLRDMAGRLRMVSRNAFQGDGIMLHGVVDGQQVNTWSCRTGGES